jgi:hypothetical protein
MHARFIRVTLGLLAFILLSGAATVKKPITAVFATGFGEYGEDAEILIDQSIPAEGTEYLDSACVYWYSTDTYFIIDLGKVFLLEGITLQVDNNDDYTLEASEDGDEFSPLLYISADWGETGFGMETLSTLEGDPEKVPGAVISPTRARFLKLAATGGDQAYAVSEVMIFGKEALAMVCPKPGQDEIDIHEKDSENQ